MEVRTIEIDPVRRDEIWQRQARLSQISWGAIFAGTICALAVSWLMNFFGITLGFTIADATDGESVGEGLAWTTVGWIIISMLVSYFVGGWIAARLAGRPDDTAGMLHGMTVWSLGTIATLVMVSMGVSNLIYSGYQVLSGTVQAAANVTSAAAQGMSNAAQGTTDLAANAISGMPLQQMRDSEIVTQLAAQMKERAAEVIANSEDPQGAQVNKDEVRVAMDNLDQQTFTDLVTKLTDDKPDEAKQLIAEKTDLSPEQIDSLMTGISKQIQKEIGTDNNNQNLVADVKTIVQNYTVRKIADSDAAGGPELNEQQVQEALNQLDYNEMKTIGMHMVNGKPESAKNVLVASTNLSRAQVNDVVDGVYAEVKPTIDEYNKTVEDMKVTANAAVEKASDYTQGVLWLIFASSALALAVAVLGGKMGADEAQRNVAYAYNATRS